MNDKPYGCLYVKSGRYYARIYYYDDGVRKQKNCATGVVVDNSSQRKAKQSEKAAQRVLAELLNSFVLPAEQDHAIKQEQLFADTAKDWMERQYGAKAPSTIAGYQYIVNDIVFYFSEINPIRAVDLTSSMVENYLTWERQRRQVDYEGPYKRTVKYKDLSGVENTVLHRAAVLRAILQWLKRDGVVSVNVASKRDCWVDLPQPQQHVFEVFTPGEADEFIEVLKGEPLWFRVAVLIALLLGLRRSEVIGLCEMDLDMKTRELKILRVVTEQAGDGNKKKLTVKPKTKNRKPKCFILEAGLFACLTAIIEENHKNEEVFGGSYDQEWKGYLFRDKDGKLITPDTLTKTFSRFIKRVGCKKLRFHDLRHSCASILHAHGVSLKTIQEILGHSQLSTTIMYTHLYEDEKAQALSYMSMRYLGPGRPNDSSSSDKDPNKKTDRNSDRNLCET
ncbi:MAG: tyrosine-type recombinase/integrase [Oscillospiraceae bacterium]